MEKALLKHTRHFISGTLLSRITGFMRDVSMAYAFGDIPEVASLILAYRLCMLLRRVLGEGSMQSAFIPGYQSVKEKDPLLALYFFKNVLFKLLLGVVLLCLLLAGIGLVFESSFAPSWQPLCNLFIRLLPGLVFVVGYSLFQALLQCHSQYFLASLAPIFSNLLWSLGCIIYRNKPPIEAMKGVSLYIGLGLLAQWLILAPQVRKILKDAKVRLLKTKADPLHFDFNFFKALALAAIGISATQINSALDGIFAKFADPKGPIYLWFSIRIQQLPLALLSIGLISASTPRLCQLVASGLKEEASSLCQSVSSKLSILMTFITFGILCMGGAILQLLFEHGMFSSSATSQTHLCLLCYMIGLIPTSLATLYASFFYALKDYKTPSYVSVICLIANLILNALMIFIFKWGPWSVAFSTSLCSFLNASLLKRALVKKELLKPVLWMPTVRSYLSAIFASTSVLALTPLTGTLPSLISLPVLASVFIVSYTLACKWVQFNEPIELAKLLFHLKSEPQESP